MMMMSSGGPHAAAPPSKAELDRVRELAASGRDADLLFLAVEHARLSSIAQLLSGSAGGGGASPHPHKAALLSAVDAQGATALHRACEKGHADVVRTLLAAGAPSNARWRGKCPLECGPPGGAEPFETALLQAVCVDDTARVGELLDGKVDANSNGVICWAAAQGHAGVVRALVERGGARLDAVSEAGKTALELAVSNNHHGVVQLLQELLQRQDSESKAATTVAGTEAGAAGSHNMSAAGTEAGATALPHSARLERRCSDLERQLAEQHELVAGLRDMLNTLLEENGTHGLVLSLQSELKRVKEEAKILAESSFRHLGMRKNSSRVRSITARERMCSADIVAEGSRSGKRVEGAVVAGGSHCDAAAGSAAATAERDERPPQTTLEYFLDTLGLYEEVSESEGSGGSGSEYDEDDDDMGSGASGREDGDPEFDEDGFTGRIFGKPMTV